MASSMLSTSGLPVKIMIREAPTHRRVDFSKSLGVQHNNQNFFGEISRILFLYCVVRRGFYLQCLHVAIAHLTQYFFFRCYAV